MLIFNPRIVFMLFSVLIQALFGFALLYIASIIKNKKEKFCTKCGTEVKSNYKYCKNCGKELNVGYNEIAVIIISALGIIVIVSCALYLLFFTMMVLIFELI